VYKEKFRLDGKVAMSRRRPRAASRWRWPLRKKAPRSSSLPALRGRSMRSLPRSGRPGQGAGRVHGHRPQRLPALVEAAIRVRPPGRDDEQRRHRRLFGPQEPWTTCSRTGSTPSTSTSTAPITAPRRPEKSWSSKVRRLDHQHVLGHRLRGTAATALRRGQGRRHRADEDHRGQLVSTESGQCDRPGFVSQFPPRGRKSRRASRRGRYMPCSAWASLGAGRAGGLSGFGRLQL
jgi:hypothetical protein